ncbi:MAG: hypothetical protein SFV32_12470 [Opitutaceae bacterium]|nr:hypothetical protein [Opitutaceae bacterium]
MSNESFQTSSEAYHWAVDSGVVSEREAQVLNVLQQGRMNQTMAHQAIVRLTGKSIEKYSVSPRFAVLLRMGLIREVGKGPCPVSNRTTVFYELTNQRPKCTHAEALKQNKDERQKTREVLERELREMQEENQRLRALLDIRTKKNAQAAERIRTQPVAIQMDLPQE